MAPGDGGAGRLSVPHGRALATRRGSEGQEGAAPSDVAFTLVAVVVALLPRLFVALAWSREPVWDGHYYHFGAVRIAEGLGYSDDIVVGGVRTWHPWAHYPVGYSAFLAVVYRFFGS